MPFSPTLSDRLILPQIEQSVDAEYRFEPNPLMKDVPYQEAAGKAWVYKLRRTSDDSFWALKVFKVREQRRLLAKTDQESSLKRIAGVRGFPRFAALERLTISPSHAEAQSHPELRLAILMKWAPGVTVAELMLNPAVHGKQRGAFIGASFARLMAHLEFIGVVHGDVSNRNVTVREQFGNLSDVQLIDIEDMWMNGIDATMDCAPGYSHPVFKNGPIAARPAGDRYAATILLGEILLIDNAVAQVELAKEGQFFMGSRLNEIGRRRYESVRPWFHATYPSYAQMLDVAWNSNTLEECPPIASLADAMRYELDRLGTPRVRARRCLRCGRLFPEQEAYCPSCNQALKFSLG